MPSRHASETELVELCSVLRDTSAVALEFIPTIERFDDEVYQLLTDMSVAADRPLNWNVIFANARQADVIQEKLRASDFAAEQGGRVVALTAPMPAESRLCFERFLSGAFRNQVVERPVSITVSAVMGS